MFFDEKKANQLAKEKDNGFFAQFGMRSWCARWFGIEDTNSDCIRYIVDTYLECIDDISFYEWINGSRKNTKPQILRRIDLENNFSDLLVYSNDLEEIANLFMYLYNQEFWVDRQADCIYATEYNLTFDRHKLNYINICADYERLCILHEKEILQWEDINDIVAYLYSNGYDIEKDYKFLDDDLYQTACNIEERLQQVFSL